MKFVCHPSGVFPGHMGGGGGGGGGGVLPSHTIGEVCPPCVIFNPHGLFATLDMYSAWTEKEYSHMCVPICLFRKMFWGKPFLNYCFTHFTSVCE